MFTVGLEAMHFLRHVRDQITGIGNTIVAIVEFVTASVVRLVSSNWLVSYFLGPILRHYATSTHGSLRSVTANMGQLGDEVGGHLQSVTGNVQTQMIGAMQTGFGRMYRNVRAREMNGTQGWRGNRCHRSYGESVSVNQMSRLQKLGVQCVREYQQAVAMGLNLVERAVDLVRWNVANVVELVQSAAHLSLYQV